MDPEGTKEARPIRWQTKDGPYDVTLRFAPIEGRMECVGVDVRAVPVSRPRAVTAVALHSLPLGKLIEKRRREAGDVTVTVDPGRIAFTGQNLTTTISRRGGRPPKYTPEHWQAVARVYVEAYSRNKTPTRAVKRHFKVTESAAAKWVAKCRDLGLLPRTTRGKAKVVDAVATPATVRAVASIPTPTVRPTAAKHTKPASKKTTKRTTRGGTR